MVSGQNMLWFRKKFAFREILASVVDTYIMFFIFMLIYILQVNGCFKLSGFRKQTAIQEGWIWLRPHLYYWFVKINCWFTYINFTFFLRLSNYMFILFLPCLSHVLSKQSFSMKTYTTVVVWHICSLTLTVENLHCHLKSELLGYSTGIEGIFSWLQLFGLEFIEF